MYYKEGLLGKVDWKFFNYLKYKATELEDLGYAVNIYIKSSFIRLNDQGFGEKKDIYFYRYENGEDSTNPVFKSEFERAMKGFISYKIRFRQQGVNLADELLRNKQLPENIGDEFIESIRSKCEKVIKEKPNEFIVRPL